MSIRIALAKLLAPGVFKSNDAMRAMANQNLSVARSFSAQAVKLETKLAHRERALRNIIALKTPGCAHVGKKMAEVAKAALHSQPPLKDAVKEKAQ